jgi:hypothetical protein
MNSIIEDWFYVIKNCSVENTYKMAWAKAIIECCLESDDGIIHFNRISSKMFKYYWNQTIFFDLRQGSNPNKPPALIQYVREEIERYSKLYGNKPEMFEKIGGKVEINFKKINSILIQDVSHRFLKIGIKKFPLYQLNKTGREIKLLDPFILKDYSDILFELINFRWTQIAEGFNSAPRISKKIKITDHGGIKRKSLSKFHKYLTLSSTECFICSKELRGDISIDHVIPYSYMYSDDLWNLVYTHKACNSRKSNRVVGEDVIQKLEIRNNTLKSILEEREINDVQYQELKLAIEENRLRKFWIAFK